MAKPGDKVSEVLLDPKWGWGTISLGDAQFPSITLTHPRYGDIICLVTPETVSHLVEGLSGLIPGRVLNG